ncbi:hypothetical protein P7C71_g5852, partial [Lecanoromycetidae sp. Uapishka_2]
MLSDPKKKEAWDQYGAAAFDQGAGFDPSGAGANGAGGPFGGGAGGFGGGFSSGGFGADINFEDLFGAFTGGGRRGRGSRQSPLQEEVLVGQNIEVQTNISFMDAAKGTSKDIFITPDSSSPSQGSPFSSTSADSHKDEGFLKAAWHKLTHQHDNLPPEEASSGPKTEDKAHEEEPKKASGSG